MIAFDTHLARNGDNFLTTRTGRLRQQEKGKTMPQDSEQSQTKRRSRPTTGGQDAMPLPTYPKARKPSPSTQTDSYSIDEGLDVPRSNTSAIRLDVPQNTQIQRTTGSQPSSTPIPSRRQQGTSRNLPSPRQTRQPAPSASSEGRHKRVHWLLPVGVGMIAMLVLWMIGASVVAWGTQRYYDVIYGNPRTSQTDVAVGHGGDSPSHPSHFIAMNLHRQAIVVEFIAGDPANSVTYLAPVYIAGDGGDLAPVTLEFRDLTKDGKKDMIIHIHLPGQDQVSVFINEGNKFRPATPNDKIQVSLPGTS